MTTNEDQSSFENEETYQPVFVDSFKCYIKDSSDERVKGFLDAVLTLTNQVGELFSTPLAGGASFDNSPSIVRTKLKEFHAQKMLFLSQASKSSVSELAKNHDLKI